MTQIDHIGIAVKSLAAAKSIYEKLGLVVSPEETVEQEQVRLVMVPVGESRLELLEATSDTSTIAKFIAKRGEGLHHVCLRVPDLPAAVERLVRFLEFMSICPRTGTDWFDAFARFCKAGLCTSDCQACLKLCAERMQIERPTKPVE